MNKNKKIKYDKTDHKIFLIVAVICTLLFLLSLLALFTGFEDHFLVLIGILLLSTPIVGIAAWYGYIDCSLYFKELRRHGIEPPMHKKNEDEISRFMMMTEKAYNTEKNVQGSAEGAPGTSREPYCKKSMILGGLAFTIAAGLLIWFIRYALHFIKLGMAGEIGFMSAIGGLIIGCWILGGCVYWNQRSNDKYREEGDPDWTRKPRTNFIKGILTIVIMLCITSMMYRTIYEMTDYVYKSMLQNLYGDQHWRLHIGDRVDLTRQEAFLKDWYEYYPEFTPWDQGGTIWKCENLYSDDEDPCIEIVIDYDADWEGERAIERYCDTLNSEGWKLERDYPRYVKTIDGKVYVIDLSGLDQKNKSNLTILYYTENCPYYIE